MSFDNADQLRDLIADNLLTDSEIIQIVKDKDFRKAIKVIFGTDDMNRLHAISTSTNDILKYVTNIHENNKVIE